MFQSHNILQWLGTVRPRVELLISQNTVTTTRFNVVLAVRLKATVIFSEERLALRKWPRGFQRV